MQISESYLYLISSAKRFDFLNMREFAVFMLSINRLRHELQSLFLSRKWLLDSYLY